MSTECPNNMQLCKGNYSAAVTEFKKINQIYSKTYRKMGVEKSRGNQCHRNP